MLGRLETGDLSDLFRAELDGQQVVVKLFHPKTTDPAYARVVAQTANQLQQITHRGVAHVNRVGITRQRLAVVREYFGRFTLGQALVRLNTREVLLPPAVALSLVIELLEVLEAAHRVGVVHGAITPGNVLLAADGAVGLADFGALAALQASDSLRRAFAGKGRSSYRAPELSGSEPATVASDLYALGALLYELLTLREASSGPQALTTRREKLVAPSRLVRRMNARIDPIVMRALETDPARRFRSCVELSAALRDYLLANGGMPSRDDVRKFVDALFPNELGLGGLGPVPFELFEIEDITGVLPIQGDLSEVAVRPPFSPDRASTDPELSVIVESTLTWHAPEGPAPKPERRPRAVEKPPSQPLPLARPTEIDQPAMPAPAPVPGPETLETKVPPTRRMFAFPFAAATDDEHPVLLPTPLWVRRGGLLLTLAAVALILYWAMRPAPVLEAVPMPPPDCYQSPNVKNVAYLMVSGAPVGATLEIDGLRLCAAWMTRVPIAPGARSVRVTHPKTGQVFEASNRFEAGKTTKVTAVFR